MRHDLADAHELPEPHDLPDTVQSIIEERVGAVLFRSGLPVERRAEVGEEMRSHLEEGVSRHGEAGLSASRAIERALAEFGDPRRIRRQLRRQQLRLDRDAALGELRRGLGSALVPGVLMAAAVGLTMTSVPMGTRLAVSVSVFVCLSVGLVLPGMFLFALLRTRLQRSSPREEYVLSRSLIRWAMVVSASLAGVIGVSAVLYGAGSALGDSTPIVELFRNLVRTTSPQWWQASVLGASVTAPVVLLAATGLALYERTRCVDAASECLRSSDPA